ncbi:hypothetical protein [Carnimonas bestiolae]|uniref:hypothetical protein n=1 Tax=Carnimonas bestiolae TaxID=3402172 RepID=UPI003F4ABFDA
MTIEDHSAQVLSALKKATSKEVLVGIPSTANDRDDGSKITNSQIGYINEFGSPIHNIPARPHLIPGILSTRNTWVGLLRKLPFTTGTNAEIRQTLEQVGETAASGVRSYIRHAEFTPLSPATIEARLRRTSSRKGNNESNPRPLVDTGEYSRSITYVVEDADG